MNQWMRKSLALLVALMMALSGLALAEPLEAPPEQYTAELGEEEIEETEDASIEEQAEAVESAAATVNGTIEYWDWNTGSNQLEAQTYTGDYTRVTSSTEAQTWDNGWYLVDEDVTIEGRITLAGTVNLVLADDVTLHAPAGITVSSLGDYAGFSLFIPLRLTIYGGAKSSGTLLIDGVAEGNAGIGGISGGQCGSVTINGGIITVTGGKNAVGIGNGYGCQPTSPIGGYEDCIYIYHGNITVTGGDNAEAITNRSTGAVAHPGLAIANSVVVKAGESASNYSTITDISSFQGSHPYKWVMFAQEYSITVDPNIQNGWMSTDKTTAATGDTVTLTAQPRFDELEIVVVRIWYDDTEIPYSRNGRYYSFTMPAHDVNATVTFKYPLELTVENVDGFVGGGLILSTYRPPAGDRVTITANPDPGYELTEIVPKLVGGPYLDHINGVAGQREYTFEMSSENAYLIPVFSSWKRLYSQIEAAEDGDVIQLETDVNARVMISLWGKDNPELKGDGSLSITIDKDITLDLNGHTLKFGGLTSSFTVEASKTLTVKDSVGNGRITGSSTFVDIKENGTLIMDSGIIDGGTTGVDLSTGRFIMNGGTIRSCKNYGVHVSGNGSFTLSGGTISGNVYNSTSHAERNVYLEDGAMLNIGENVAEDTYVGVTMASLTQENAPLAFTSGLNNRDPSFLFSDNSLYDVGLNDSGEAELYVGPPKYNVKVARTNHGSISPSRWEVAEGGTVTLTAYPENSDYSLRHLKVWDMNGNEVEVTDNNTFIMPASDVMVSSWFYKRHYGDTTTVYFYDALNWCHYTTGGFFTVLGSAEDYPTSAGFDHLFNAFVADIKDGHAIYRIDVPYYIKRYSFSYSSESKDHIRNWSNIMWAPTGERHSNGDYILGLTHTIDIDDSITGGKVTVDRSLYAENSTVPLTVTPDAGYEVESIQVNGTQITPTDGAYNFTMPAQDATVTATFTQAGPKFAGYRLRLSGILGLRYFMRMPDGFDDAGARMTFTIEGATQTVTQYVEETLSGATYRVYECGVHAYQMAENITAVFSYGDGQSVTKEYSVETYLDKVTMGDYSANAQALMTATRVYGHFIQPYLYDVNGTTHATLDYDGSANVSEAKTGAADYALVKPIHDLRVSKAQYYLTVADSTTLNIEMTLDGAYENVTVTLDGNAYNPAVTGNTYQVRIANIAANNLGVGHRVALMIGGETVFDATVSAISYVSTMINGVNTDENELNALSSLYHYFKAAETYVANPNE